MDLPKLLSKFPSLLSPHISPPNICIPITSHPHQFYAIFTATPIISTLPTIPITPEASHCHTTEKADFAQIFMTVVRRPAYVTHSCPEPGSSNFWEDALPSRKTKLKSESAKRYLEDHFVALMQETEARKQRLQKFHEQMECANLSEADKEQLYRQFQQEETEFSRLSRTRISSSRYQRIKLIGRGGFGDVWLVQDKTNSELFALKILKKSDIIMKDQLVNVRQERDILSAVSNPWVVQLYCSFQDPQRLYLVLEYMCGGDLMAALIKKEKFTEQETRFFAGEIAMALHSIHEMHLLHRDLKPDNVLIGANGHIKLTDFGLSTNYLKQDYGLHELMDQFHEELLVDTPFETAHYRRGDAVGTCGYTAPEVWRGQPNTIASDYWSLGVIIYEMLFGFPPFVGKSMQETGLRIIHWKRSLRLPRDAGVSELAIDLIRHLLCEPDVRYGYDEIVTHPFFNGFRFDAMEGNIPPMVPIIRYPTDTSHFEDIEPEPEELFGEKLPNDELAKFAFLGFTFKQRPQSPTMARLVNSFS